MATRQIATAGDNAKGFPGKRARLSHTRAPSPPELQADSGQILRIRVAHG
jgi:hypothetical protein